MKHIKYFETKADRDATVLVGPFLAYTKETNSLEVEGVTPINIVDQPNLMAKMYEWGWAESPNYMTLKECAAVTDAQFGSKKGALRVNSAFAGCTEDFSGFKYFTSITTIPSYMFYGCSFTKFELPNSISVLEDYGLVGSWYNGVLDLSNTKIEGMGALFYYHSSQSSAQNRASGNIYVTAVKLPVSCNKIGISATKAWSDVAQGTPNIAWVTLPYNGVVATGYNTKLLNFRYYVPDELVDIYKADSTTGYSKWNTVADKIFPISQWQTDIDNGVIHL